MIIATKNIIFHLINYESFILLRTSNRGEGSEGCEGIISIMAVIIQDIA
jgi:hypothetical protein